MLRGGEPAEASAQPSPLRLFQAAVARRRRSKLRPRNRRGNVLAAPAGARRSGCPSMRSNRAGLRMS